MPRPLLDRKNQETLAAICLLAIALVAGLWIYSGGPQGKLIDIDRAKPRDYRFVVDLNQATWPELAQLPEVGEVLARRIVARRREQGEYRSRDDLLDVSGIGPRTLARIAPYLAPLPDDVAVAEK